MRRWKDDEGAGLVEYALLIALIAMVCIGALQYFGGESGNSLENSKSRIIEATEP
jgi:Flp pilus assembly pilin Flp